MLEFGFHKASIIFWAFGITRGKNRDETCKNLIVTEKVYDRLYSLHQEMEFDQDRAEELFVGSYAK